jgi:hypothetical protein
LEQEAEKEWIGGKGFVLTIQEKGSSSTRDLKLESERWKKRMLAGEEWMRKVWLEWYKDNPDWALEWKAPEAWPPGERQWFEG